MRFPRLFTAAVLLLGVVFALTALFAQPPYSSTGLTSLAVFVPLWYLISVLNAWIGVSRAGYSLTGEGRMFVVVFGLPMILAALTAYVCATVFGGGPVITSGREPLILATGVALWGSAWLLAGLLGGRTGKDRFAAALAVFLPLWLVICVVNLLIGVWAAGYGLAVEIPIAVLDFGAPTAAALAAWWFAPNPVNERSA
jgi:hypothetical protein